MKQRMKHRFAGAHGNAPLFVLAFLPSLSAHAFAQTLPLLEVSPPVLGADRGLLLSLPDAPPKNARIAVYEKSRPTKLAEIKKNFTLQNGRWSTPVRLEADPGRYELRIVADDKLRTPLSADAGVLVPGIVREPGWWLLNGSPFIEMLGQTNTPPAIDAPLFIPGLKRDGKKFERKVFTSSGAPIRWKTFELPSLQEIVEAKNYDYAALQSRLAQEIEAARLKGERNFLGFSVANRKSYSAGGEAPFRITPPLAAASAREALMRLRQITNALQPEAALIYQTTFGENNEADVTRVMEECAALCDAIVLRPGSLTGYFPGVVTSWNIKVARRIAEEQAHYDLPIFLISPWRAKERVGESSILIRPRDVFLETPLTDFWMSGATGGVLHEPHADNALSALNRTVQRNASLFIGSATLEDTGFFLWPQTKFLNLRLRLSEDDDDDDDSSSTVGAGDLYSHLRSAGRIPLAARIQQKQGKKIPESFLTILGDTINGETIEKLRIAANGGARIYLEGSPKIEGDVARWNALVGATSTPLAASEGKNAQLVLDDPWMFGTSRGKEILVRQTTTVSLNPPVAKPKKDELEKGKDILTEPRVVARLKDGTPGLILNPVGEGEVLWSPHRSVHSNSTHLSSFYHAIAAHLGTGLVKIRAAQGESTPPVRVALRRSPEGAWLIGLFNGSTLPTPILLEANHFAGVALELAAEKELSLQTRGNRSFVETTVPASGWQIIALGESRKVLDEERFAPRSKVRLK